MAEFADDPESETILQKIATYFDSVRAWIYLSIQCLCILRDHYDFFSKIGPAQVIEKENFGEFVNKTDCATLNEAQHC